MTKEQVVTFFNSRGIPVDSLQTVKGSFDKDIFLVNGTHVLRPSHADMTKELDSFRRIAHLQHVPRIVDSGTFESDGTCQFILVSLLPGDDLIGAQENLCEAESEELGRALAAFLDSLHGISGTSWDIGHYVPLVPQPVQSWRSGHRAYREFLESSLKDLPCAEKPVYGRAFSLLRELEDSLSFQGGPVLLHNDFHPKNIIVNRGRFSGVIDWECSQFGEADFELCHLIHWCLFPPKEGSGFHPVLGSLLRARPRCTRVSDLEARLTIYQIEHELVQILWSGGSRAAECERRLEVWLSGAVGKLLAGLNY